MPPDADAPRFARVVDRAAAFHHVTHRVLLVTGHAHETPGGIAGYPWAVGGELAPPVLDHEDIGDLHDPLAALRHTAVEHGLSALLPHRLRSHRVVAELGTGGHRV